MIKSESLATLAKALVKAQKEMGAAIKDAKNPFFKSNYADLGAVIDASVPELNKAGIAVLQVPTTIEHGMTQGKAVLRTILLHESGEFIASDTDIICSKQNDPQSYGSAISYARRYGLQAMATLKAEDDDGNSASGKELAKATKPIIAARTTIATVVEAPQVVSTNEPAKKKVSFSKKSLTTTATQVQTGDDI